MRLRCVGITLGSELKKTCTEIDPSLQEQVESTYYFVQIVIWGLLFLFNPLPSFIRQTQKNNYSI